MIRWRPPAPRGFTLPDVLCGTVNPDSRDDAGKALLRQMLDDARADHHEAMQRHPAMQVLRREWARLGIPDPGEYEHINIIEEAIRLVGLPDPVLPPKPRCGLVKLGSRPGREHDWPDPAFNQRRRQTGLIPGTGKRVSLRGGYPTCGGSAAT
jgi:hypothetical protein